MIYYPAKKANTQEVRISHAERMYGVNPVAAILIITLIKLFLDTCSMFRTCSAGLKHIAANS